MNLEQNFIVLREPHTSEKSLILADKLKQFVFRVSSTANKIEIKKAVEAIFNVKVEKVRTHIKLNKKFAYIKLKKANPAIDIATKLGMI